MNDNLNDKVIIDDAVSEEYNTAVVADAKVVANDDTVTDDAVTGATIGGLGSAAVGAIAGSLVGPVGAAIGAVAGGLVGAAASGAAVQAVDSVDNDGSPNEGLHVSDEEVETVHRGPGIPMVVPGAPKDELPKQPILDTRDATEKIADALTGDPYDDKTGLRVDRPGDQGR